MCVYVCVYVLCSKYEREDEREKIDVCGVVLCMCERVRLGVMRCWGCVWKASGGRGGGSRSGDHYLSEKLEGHCVASAAGIVHGRDNWRGDAPLVPNLLRRSRCAAPDARLEHSRTTRKIHWVTHGEVDREP